MNDSKNSKQLADFREFCVTHPELRFWQALRAWSGFGFILKADGRDIVSDEWADVRDTFYFEGRNK